MKSDLLATLRASGPSDLKTVRQAFYAAHQHLINKVLPPEKQSEEIDLYGTLYEGLAIATERLRTNSKTADEVDAYIVDELRSMKVQHFTRDSQNILAPQGSDLPDLKRKRGADQKNYTSEKPGLLNQAPKQTVTVTGRGGQYIPARVDTAKETDLEDTLATNELQKSILDLLVAGHSQRKVADLLCLTEHRVREVHELFYRRAEAAGHKPERKRKSS